MRPLRPEQTATQSGCCQLVNRGTFIGSSFLAVQTLPPALALGIAAGAEDQRVQRRALVSKAPSLGAARSTPGSEHPKVCRAGRWPAPPRATGHTVPHVSLRPPCFIWSGNLTGDSRQWGH